MVDYEKQFREREYSAVGSRQTSVATTFKLVYSWMCAGLALSGVVAWYTVSSGLCQKVLMGPGMLLCIIAELGLVIAIGAAINKISAPAAYALFLAYAAVNGLTLSVVFLAYDLELVQRVFFITAGMFGGLALYGSFTKSDLSSVGSFCGMALWGLILAVVINLFCHSSGLDWVITFAGILIFTGLTMYDAQKIRQLAAAERGFDSGTLHKVAILGALQLYLDFINLFLYLLRFFGRKR